MFDCEQLQTPLLDAQMALSKLRLCDLFWVAWTEFGSVGVGRRTSLRQIDKFSQIRATPGWTPSAPEAPGYRLKVGTPGLGVTRKCSQAAGVTSYALFTPTNTTVHTTHPAIT
jgi:hypothetical protein